MQIGKEVLNKHGVPHYRTRGSSVASDRNSWPTKKGMSVQMQCSLMFTFSNYAFEFLNDRIENFSKNV